MEEMTKEWLRHVQHNHSRHTLISYRKVLDRLLSYAPPSYRDLNPEHIEEFLTSQKLGSNSKNTFLAAIKSFCRYCEKFHSLPNPSKKVSFLKIVPYKQNLISLADLEKVLEICKPEVQSVLIFLMNTGIRVGELCQLKPENINGRLLYVYSKGRQRAVPLNQTAQKHLPNTMKFLRSHRGSSTLYNICQRLGKRAGVKFTPHSLRHLYATLLSKSIPLCVLSKLLGHKNTLITEQVYVHLFDSDLEGATDVLDD